MELSTSIAYTVCPYEGLAFRLIGHAQRWEPFTFIYAEGEGEDEDDAIEIEVTTDDGEYVEDPDMVIVVAIGDDRRIRVPIEDLTPLSDHRFCASCGQIGCTHDVRASESD